MWKQEPIKKQVSNCMWFWLHVIPSIHAFYILTNNQQVKHRYPNNKICIIDYLIHRHARSSLMVSGVDELNTQGKHQSIEGTKH